MILLLKIMTLLLGLLFTLFGYFIYFRKKYNLINDFENELKAGLKTEKYAKTVGIIEFLLGLTLIVAGIILFIFA